jgi:hypothetical protein
MGKLLGWLLGTRSERDRELSGGARAAPPPLLEIRRGAGLCRAIRGGGVSSGS